MAELPSDAGLVGVIQGTGDLGDQLRTLADVGPAGLVEFLDRAGVVRST